jgi:CheY-like chemotaxis protein
MRQSEDLTGLVLVVVDDETDARNFIKRVLEERGAKVVAVGSAAEAIPMIEREKPDVLVSDIGMPDVDGYEFLRRVRSLDAINARKIPAIALTAFARSEDRTLALRNGYLVHVAKPVDPSELIATIASVAGRSGLYGDVGAEHLD